MEDNTKSPKYPRYTSHKEVEAFKIGHVDRKDDGSAILIPEDPTQEPLVVSSSYMEKHRPEAGGYFVQYADAYQSFSPAEAFEKGYTLNEIAPDHYEQRQGFDEAKQKQPSAEASPAQASGQSEQSEAAEPLSQADGGASEDAPRDPIEAPAADRDPIEEAEPQAPEEPSAEMQQSPPASSEAAAGGSQSSF